MMTITKADFKKICEMQIRTKTAYCCLCGKLINKVDEYNIEHLHPRSRGGEDSVENWRVAHKTYNTKKGALTFEEWKQWLALERKRNGITK